MVDLISQSVLQALFNIVPELKLVPGPVLNFAFLYCFIEDPRSSDFGEINILDTCIKKRKYVSFSTRYNAIFSNSVKIILKRIELRSYYRALDLLLFIPDLVQRNFILQVFNSASSYLQNNYDVNIIKLWINSIYVKKDEKINELIKFHKTTNDLPFSYHISIEFGFYVD
jgi:hypothetical protein